MNKKMGALLACLFLSACHSGVQGPVLEKPPPGENHQAGPTAFYDTVGFPWVHMVPSKRALAYQDVPFHMVQKKVRSSVAMEDAKCRCKRFKGLSMILVDYGVVPTPETENLINSEIQKIHNVVAEYEGKEPVEIKPFNNVPPGPYAMYRGEPYLMSYKEQPTGYVMTLSFFTNNTRPPCPPMFVGTAFMNEQSAGSFEAFAYMAEEIVLEHIKHPEKKEIHLCLN